MVQSNLELKDVIEILRRHKFTFIIPFLVVFVTGAAIAFGLPAVYEASSTILIEQQEIPTNLVASTVTSYASERIQVIGQRVMTTANLTKVVEKLDLYPEERASGIGYDIISRLRENIGIEMVSADVIDPRTGRPASATIAFRLSFESPNPELTKIVADEITSLYLTENINLRKQKAETTTEFLASEAERLGNTISVLEARLAQYKERNVGRLPELMQFNMNLMERTERELETIENQIKTLEQRKVLLDGQISQTEPFTGTSPEARYRTLQSNYLSLSAVYSDNHPDLQRIRRELDVLKIQIGIVDDSSVLQEKLRTTRKNLSAARERYSEEHPDVQKLKKLVVSIEAQILNTSATGNSKIIIEPDNPIYINLKTQYEGMLIEIQAAKEKRIRLKEKLSTYEQRLLDMPSVEQEGYSVKRDYENAVRQYKEIKKKQLNAQVAEQLESESKGERFTLIEPAFVPAEPIRPNRPAILFLAIVLALAGGFGFVTVAEILDNTIRGSKSLVATLGAYPLSVIPNKKIPSLNRS